MNCNKMFRCREQEAVELLKKPNPITVIVVVKHSVTVVIYNHISEFILEGHLINVNTVVKHFSKIVAKTFKNSYWSRNLISIYAVVKLLK